MNNKCEVCGAECKNKYCDNCREKAYHQRAKLSHNGFLRTKFKGCNEDCFNCPYPDCLKPAAKMKRDKFYETALAEV